MYGYFAGILKRRIHAYHPGTAVNIRVGVGQNCISNKLYTKLSSLCNTIYYIVKGIDEGRKYTPVQK